MKLCWVAIVSKRDHRPKWMLFSVHWIDYYLIDQLRVVGDVHRCFMPIYQSDKNIPKNQLNTPPPPLSELLRANLKVFFSSFFCCCWTTICLFTHWKRIQRKKLSFCLPPLRFEQLSLFILKLSLTSNHRFGR